MSTNTKYKRIFFPLLLYDCCGTFKIQRHYKNTEQINSYKIDNTLMELHKPSTISHNFLILANEQNKMTNN